MSKEPSDDPDNLVSMTFRIHRRQANALRKLYRITKVKQADLVRQKFEQFEADLREAQRVEQELRKLLTKG